MKKYFLFVNAFLVLILLSSCYRAPQQPRSVPFTIEVNVDKPVYRVGDNVTIVVRTNRDSYLALYDISTQGEITQIFPNCYAQDNKIQGGKTYHIPTPSDEFDFLVEQGPPGMERIRAVGTLKNVNLFKTSQCGSDEVFPKINKAPEQFEDSLNQKLGGMPSEQWSEASITFEIR